MTQFVKDVKKGERCNAVRGAMQFATTHAIYRYNTPAIESMGLKGSVLFTGVQHSQGIRQNGDFDKFILY